jgi:hypothetical protein
MKNICHPPRSHSEISLSISFCILFLRRKWKILQASPQDLTTHPTLSFHTLFPKKGMQQRMYMQIRQGQAIKLTKTSISGSVVF